MNDPNFKQCGALNITRVAGSGTAHLPPYNGCGQPIRQDCQDEKKQSQNIYYPERLVDFF